MTSKTSDVLDEKFAALSHPLRRDMLERIVRGDITLNELASRYSISTPAVAKHVGVLEKAGFLRKGPRSSTRLLSFEHGSLEPLADWMTGNAAFWSGSFDRLHALLKEEHN